MAKRLAVVLVLAVAVTGCSRIGPGYVGVRVNMAGDNRGVDNVPGRTGWVFYNPISQAVYEYPTFVQTAVWTKDEHEGSEANEEITFTTGDQMQVAADISLAYLLRPEKVPQFYVTFRSDDITKFTHGYMRNQARDKFDSVAGKYKIEEIMGDNARFMNEVRAALQAEMEPIGIEIKQFGFIGAPRPPQTVINAINEKVKAQQTALQKQTEVQAEIAEANKKIEQARGQAESILRVAKAQAEANHILSESLTGNYLEYKKLEKWNGALPQVASGSAMPIVTVK